VGTPLTRGELEIMNVVWQRGRVTVHDVCDSLARPLAYTTVMTVLKSLEIKRAAVRKVKVGRAYVYEATVSRGDACLALLSDLRRDLSSSSLKSVVLNLIQDGAISGADLADIKKALSKIEAEK
jgi:BlaI family penicillinase repressor